MRYEATATLILLLTTGLTGLVGAVPLSLGILATYGLIRTIVRRQRLAKGAARAIDLAFGVAALPMILFLVHLWSFTLDLSSPVGGAVWLGILASLEHGLQTVARWKEHHKADAILDPPAEVQQAA